MKAFWRKKIHINTSFYEGELSDRKPGLVKLSERENGESRWYKEDEIELFIEEEAKP